MASLEPSHPINLIDATEVQKFQRRHRVSGEISKHSALVLEIDGKIREAMHTDRFDIRIKAPVGAGGSQKDIDDLRRDITLIYQALNFKVKIRGPDIDGETYMNISWPN